VVVVVIPFPKESHQFDSSFEGTIRFNYFPFIDSTRIEKKEIIEMKINGFLINLKKKLKIIY